VCIGAILLFRANLILIYNIPGTLFTECQGREKDIASINQVDNVHILCLSCNVRESPKTTT
jgi:hypothetical protein